MSKLLIDERPLTVLPSLVKAVGMERAVILQQIHWLLQGPSNGFEHDGERWVWGSYPDWCEDYFTFWEADTLRKHLVKLEKDGYVVSVQIKGFDRTKAYRIDRKKISEIESANRHDHATSKRKKSYSLNRHDHAASKRDDHATSNRDDHAGSKRDDHAGSYITETSTKTTTETTRNDDDEKAAGVQAIWATHFKKPMPEALIDRMDELWVKHGGDAVCHAIQAAAAEGAHNFAYIAKCARNYVPPANGNGKSYHVDLPGVYALAPTPTPPPALPPAMRHGDPWAVCLGELRATLPSGLYAMLTGSEAVEAGTAPAGDGKPVPLYRVIIAPQHAVNGLNHFTHQAGPAIRRKLGSILGKPVQIEIVAAEPQLEPQP